MDPWGTPQSISLGDERCWFTEQICRLPLRYDLNQESYLSSTPYLESLESRIE